jgi:hypothetical protein
MTCFFYPHAEYVGNCFDVHYCQNKMLCAAYKILNTIRKLRDCTSCYLYKLFLGSKTIVKQHRYYASCTNCIKNINRSTLGQNNYRHTLHADKRNMSYAKRGIAVKHFILTIMNKIFLAQQY